MELPKELPERPVGWTRQMTLHLNFGRGKGSGIYKILNEKCEEMPIGWMYRSDKKGTEQGFTLPDLEQLLSWAELRELWPAFLRRQVEKAMLEALDD